MQVSFHDFSNQNKKLKLSILKEINHILNFSDNSNHDKYIKEFEDEFANYHNVDFAIGVDSGTTALQLAMIASGIKKGDEVIVPSYTYIATALAVSNIGAKPVFVDIKESDLTINESLIEKKITDKTKAIIPVHIHGNICELNSILSICKKYNLQLIEDASQAHGASYKNKKIGSFGIGCFSLHTSKTLGGIGDAGIITSNDKRIHDKIKQLMIPDNNSEEIINSKRTPCDIDAIQAAIVKIKLTKLDELNKRKNKIARLYDRLISNKLVKKIITAKDSYSVYRDYCIIINERERLQEFLFKKGIETKARYKLPLHLTKTFEYLGYKKGDSPIAEKMANEVLCLPSFIGISDDNIKYICDEINKFV